MSARVGVDIGGTFTDIVLRRTDGTLRVSKVSSTPEDPALAVVRGLAALLRAAGVSPAAVVEVVHGTTFTLLNDEATLQLRSDRMRFLPYGLAGGGPARGTRNVLDPDGAARVMPAKFAVVLKRGDTVLHEQPGGGGFGDPFTRDPERVAVDARNEKITLEYARREHGVVLEPGTFKVDAAATRALRERRR